MAVDDFVLRCAALVAVGVLAGGCEKGPPEMVAKDKESKEVIARAPTAPKEPTPNPAAATPAAPASGPVDLKTATEGLPPTGTLYADVDTDGGKLTCKLFDDKAPKTVANFVGLARGIQAFKDPVSHTWVKRPGYDGTAFHRIIKGFMIQGGDPAGTGSGEPGYTVPDEIWPGAKHDRAGLLCMANRGPNTNGMQFFITDDAAAHLDNNYTIFGECSPLEVVHKLASTPVAGERPITKPKINKVTIRRG